MSAEMMRMVEEAARAVRSAAPVMLRREMLGQQLADAVAAEARGYFLPDEDERLREVFTRYLSIRAVLLQAVNSIQPLLDGEKNLEPAEEDDSNWDCQLRAFLVAFTAAAILVRSASYMVDLAADRPVVRKKLDEAEPRYGILRKSFTMVYKNLSSTRRMWRFHEAIGFFEANRDDLRELANDAVVGELVSLLDREEEYLKYRKVDYLKRRLNYRLHSFRRRHVSGYRKAMFHLFRLSGSAIAELRQPFVKPAGQGKRVTEEVIAEIEPKLCPGDIFITRHDDALSNLFFPGFWPHSALYIGSAEERQVLGVKTPAGMEGRCGGPVRLLEAKKDGVLFRPIRETLRVDAFVVFRPRLKNGLIAEALTRALTHEGKLYDFYFDFRNADRLACTELVYRTYHAMGPIAFELRSYLGRLSLSAEDFIEQAQTSGHFTQVAEFGVDGDDFRWFS